MDLVKFTQTMQWQSDHHTCGADLCVYCTTSLPLYWTKKIDLCYFRIPDLFPLFHDDILFLLVDHLLQSIFNLDVLLCFFVCLILW